MSLSPGLPVWGGEAGLLGALPTASGGARPRRMPDAERRGKLAGSPRPVVITPLEPSDTSGGAVSRAPWLPTLAIPGSVECGLRLSAGAPSPAWLGPQSSTIPFTHTHTHESSTDRQCGTASVTSEDPGWSPGSGGFFAFPSLALLLLGRTARADRSPSLRCHLRLAQSLWALFTSTLVISLVFAVIPLCRDVKVLALVMALAGLAMGCIDTVANMQLVRMYQKDSAVFLQVLHFFVGFGALLSPLIADPFLSEASCLPANGTVNATSRSHLFHAARVLGQHHAGVQPRPNHTLPGQPLKDGAGTRVSYAFWIMALINLPVPMAVLFLLSKERLLTCCPQRTPLLLSADELALETQPPEKEDASSLPRKNQPHPGHEGLFSCCQRKNCRGAPYSFFAIHITAALVLFMTDGMTGEYSAFVYSYAVEKPLSVGHKVAGYLPSLFWGFITLGRLISIPVSSRVKPATMVFINVVGVLVTFLFLLICSYDVLFLFLGTASLGLFLSSTFPSVLAYTEDILQYTGCATTVLVTGAGIGEMALQMLVGSIFQAQGSYSFLVCGVIFGCLAFTFYILLLFFHRIHPALSSDETRDKPLDMESAECYQR